MISQILDKSSHLPGRRRILVNQKRKSMRHSPRFKAVTDKKQQVGLAGSRGTATCTAFGRPKLPRPLAGACHRIFRGHPGWTVKASHPGLGGRRSGWLPCADPCRCSRTPQRIGSKGSQTPLTPRPQPPTPATHPTRQHRPGVDHRSARCAPQPPLHSIQCDREAIVLGRPG